MSAVAVVDLGTARVKLTIGSLADGQLIFTTSSHDAFFGAANDALARNDAVQRTRAFLVERGAFTCPVRVVIGTEYFRSGIGAESVIEQIQSFLGPINVLDPRLEARVFHAGVAATENITGAFVAADVGGGSVQVCWSHMTDDSASLPLGTFALEKMFQQTDTARHFLDDETRRQADAYIQAELDKALRPGLVAPTLVIGSNVMHDFFTAVLSATGCYPKMTHPLETLGPAELNCLLSAVVGKPYSELGRLFPSNPRFMYGADKLLLIAAALARRFKVERIRPTNESVSKALARLAMQQPEELVRLGLKVTP